MEIMPIAFPQNAVRNLASARCLRDVCVDRSLHTSKSSITDWEIWFLPDIIFAPGELTIGLIALMRQMRPLFITDRRIVMHRQNGPLTTSQPTEHVEWTWDQLAGVTRQGFRKVTLTFTDGSNLELVDRSRAGAKEFARRANAALEVVARGESLTANWQQISRIKPYPIDLQMEALEFLKGRDGSSLWAEGSRIVDELEPDEVPLAVQRWDKGLAFEGRTGVDNLFKSGTRLWVMTDRRFVELQGDDHFRIRRQWPANAIRGARLGDPERRTDDVLLVGDKEVRFPDSPRVAPPRVAEIRLAEAINEAARLVQRDGR
jgi:hypothetical protein